MKHYSNRYNVYNQFCCNVTHFEKIMHMEKKNILFKSVFNAI